MFALEVYLLTYELILKKSQEASSFPSFEDGKYL